MPSLEAPACQLMVHGGVGGWVGGLQSEVVHPPVHASVTACPHRRIL
jgi:hypothetical protein